MSSKYYGPGSQEYTEIDYSNPDAPSKGPKNRKLTGKYVGNTSADSKSINCNLKNVDSFPTKNGKPVAPDSAKHNCFINLNYRTCMDYYSSWEEIDGFRHEVYINQDNYPDGEKNDWTYLLSKKSKKRNGCC